MSDRPAAPLRERLEALSDEQRQELAGRAAQLINLRGGAQQRRQLVGFIEPSSDGAPTVQSLREFLARRLPDHMVPSRYVRVDRLPRTPAGKLDRGALLDIMGTPLDGGVGGFVLPRNETEVLLAGIWETVLGVESVGVHDDFFEIGGDSLLSIRVLARAAKAGLSIRPEVFFANSTIAALATVAREGTSDAEQGQVVGRAPLAPIQSWFFDRIHTDPQHWNQCQVFRVPPELGREALSRIIQTLVSHHDVLRARFVFDGERRMQDFQGVIASTPMRVVDLPGLAGNDRDARIASECAHEHASLDLEEGPLFRAIFFDVPEQPLLAVVAHHLVVDAISWVIIEDDLETLAGQAIDGEALQLPRKTDSARAWALALEGAAKKMDGPSEAAPWLTQPTAAEPGVWSSDGVGDGSNCAGDARVHRLSLDAAATEALISGACDRLGAAPNEVLVAGLLMAWRAWSGESALRLDLEGHGRDALADALDVSRTVGWFTTVFPVHLSSPATEPAAVVRATQDALKALPLRGAAHGLLRYSTPDSEVSHALADLPQSPVLFNFLGVESQPEPGSRISTVAMRTGPARGPRSPRAYLLEINARLVRGTLVLDIEYSDQIHLESSMQTLGTELARAFKAIAEAPTPDPGSTELDAAQMSQVADLLAELDES